MNAKEEFLAHIGNKTVESSRVYLLTEPVPDQLNFDYKNDTGELMIDGVIWYTDGTWSIREIEGGIEQWVHHKETV